MALTKPRRVRKKLIFSSYDDIYNPFYAGGGAQSIHQIAKRFTSEFDVTVITGKYRGAKKTIVDHVHYKRIGFSFLGPRIGQLVFSILLPFSVKKEQFDLWIESFTPPFSTACLQLFTKKPVIGLVHMLAAEDMERKYKLPFGTFERFGLKTYKYFITLTNVFLDKIEQSNKEAMITRIPNGVEKEVVNSSKSPTGKQYLLYLGRIEINQKGLDLLLRSYQKLSRTSDVQLFIAGSGFYREQKKLEELIKTMHLQEKVTLVGKVEGRKKIALLQHATAVVIPSRFETFCNVALEAMAYGKPIIHFTIPGLTWIPRTCSIRVKSFSIQAFYQAMENVVVEKTLRQRLAAGGRKEVRKYSWDIIFTKYSEVVHYILSDYERSIAQNNH